LGASGTGALQEQGRSARWTEEAAERQKAWSREAAEYQYKISQDRAKSKDEFDAEVARRVREENDRRLTLSKGWDERDAALKAQEKEVSDLRTQVAAFPLEVKKASETAASIAGASVKRDYEQKLEINRITSESNTKMAESQLSNQNATIQQLNAQIAALQIEVRSANTRAETIAAKAVEASSGRQALEAVQQQTTAMSNQQKTGR
jgi:hypothetical protein